MQIVIDFCRRLHYRLEIYSATYTVYFNCTENSEIISPTENVTSEFTLRIKVFDEHPTIYNYSIYIWSLHSSNMWRQNYGLERSLFVCLCQFKLAPIDVKMCHD